ncbi:MAG: DUF4337 family protein [Rhizobiales bacterium]|nr:DUF4337 family protein [Hyphomicrobiales bacterium]
MSDREAPATGSGLGIEDYLKARLDDLDGMLRKPRSDRFTNAVAICVAIISAFLAVSSVKNGNVVQANGADRREIANLWNQYQAKRLRQFVLDAKLDEYDALYAGARRAEMPPALANRIVAWTTERDRYVVELRQLSRDARAIEARVANRVVTDDQLDIAEAFLALSLALFALAALTKLGWMLALALCVGGAGGFFCIAAFTRIDWAHPMLMIRLFEG